MKIDFDIKKGTDAASNFLSKTANLGKKAVAEAQKNATAISEKAKAENDLRMLKKYNPLFWDVYNSNDFHYPSIIIIVEDSARQDIDVCKGEVGWRNSDSGAEILYLHETTAHNASISFVPAITVGGIYYVDNFESGRYIRTDCVFGKAHEERLAELKNVAHSLGAKFCSIEITESLSQQSVAGASGKIGFKQLVNVNANHSIASSENLSRSGKITAEFEGSNTPKRPKLKWFSQDDNIKKLIDMRCKSGNAIKSETLQLSGSSSATMTQKTAVAIDGAYSKMKIGAAISMENQAVREIYSTLVFRVEF